MTIQSSSQHRGMSEENPFAIGPVRGVCERDI